MQVPAIPPSAAPRRRVRGFTLIELMVTTALIAILVSIAYSAYTNQLMRGRRSGAKSAMMDIANREQEYLLATRAYANTATLTAAGYVLSADVSQWYGWAVVVGAGAVPTYTITFTPTGAQAADGALTLDQAGNRNPIAKWQN
jgi:type IV pilus assembly protein PilE